jgi:hypothetical protein
MFWDAILQRCRPWRGWQAVGMIFSGHIFDEAQSQNCETGKIRVRPAHKTGGDSGEVKYWSQKINDN